MVISHILFSEVKPKDETKNSNDHSEKDSGSLKRIQVGPPGLFCMMVFCIHQSYGVISTDGGILYGKPQRHTDIATLTLNMRKQ